MLTLSIFLVSAPMMVLACIDDYNEGLAHLNQGVNASNRGNDLHVWVTENDDSLDDAAYCEHMTQILRDYNETKAHLRNARGPLDVAARQCTGGNKDVVIDVVSTLASYLQRNADAREAIQEKLYEYCS
jgi:hypothetical protein